MENCTMIDWVCAVIEESASEPIFLSPAYRTTDAAFVVINSPILVGSKGVALRKYVVCAIEKQEEKMTEDDLPWAFLDYHKQYGVIEMLLISNVKPDNKLQNTLEKCQIRYVKIGGSEFSADQPGKYSSFVGLLLGDVLVTNGLKQLEESSSQNDTVVMNAEEAYEILRSIYKGLIVLLNAEKGILQDVERRSSILGRTLDGKVNTFAGEYAVRRQYLEEQWIECYIPQRSYLSFCFSIASQLYQALLQADFQDYADTLSILKKATLQLTRYYATWLSGKETGFDIRSILAGLDELKNVRHIHLLSGTLSDLEPIESIELLELLNQFDAVGASDDVFALLQQSINSKVQEVCLQVFENFKTCNDISQINEFLFSRSEAVRNAAIHLVGSIGGDEAADFLLRYKEDNQIDLSESFIKALGKTKSLQAFIFLLQNLDDSTSFYTEMLKEIEKLLKHFYSSDITEGLNQLGKEPWLISLCNRLLENGDRQKESVALQLIYLLDSSTALRLLEKAMRSINIRTRIAAMKVATHFPTDESVQVIIRSLEEKPDDYENARFLESLQAAFEAQNNINSDPPVLASSLDLDKAAVKTLHQINTSYALEVAKQIVTFPSEARSSEEESQLTEKENSFDLLSLAQRTSKEISIYSLPEDMRVWVEAMSSSEDDDTVSLTTIHSNGILDFAMGSKASLLRDIVYAYLRGEKPSKERFTNVKQGEVKTINMSKEEE